MGEVLGLKMADGTLRCSEYVTRSEADGMYLYVTRWNNYFFGEK